VVVQGGVCCDPVVQAHLTHAHPHATCDAYSHVSDGSAAAIATAVGPRIYSPDRRGRVERHWCLLLFITLVTPANPHDTETHPSTSGFYI